MSQLKKRRRAFARLFRQDEGIALVHEMRRMAARMARGDVELMADLVAEGTAELWERIDTLRRMKVGAEDVLEFVRERMHRYLSRSVLRHERLASRLTQEIAARVDRRIVREVA